MTGSGPGATSYGKLSPIWSTAPNIQANVPLDSDTRTKLWQLHQLVGLL